jgi:hypothetical protein
MRAGMSGVHQEWAADSIPDAGKSRQTPFAIDRPVGRMLRSTGKNGQKWRREILRHRLASEIEPIAIVP